ncbi:polysaccharide biosynthesis tyrosine autokinase [Ornithinicoccus halotolerans]|uniref:polysaccharide biosynthesis tyrosine autokinase n=1 Tax=Ornithinicoccus halotolerans TaxID=1748220 RepID=UPI001297EE98|nr:polysaccharide biosynthesis tyrosine autokinase [Ornithinicoccus halotolerans]
MIRRLLQDGVTLRRGLVVLACALLGMALAALYAAQMPLTYQASATVLVSSVTRDGENNPLTETNDAQQKVLTLAQLATSNVVVSRVIDSMGLDQVPESLQASLQAEAVPQTVLVEITAQDPDPSRAREIVNFVALELDGYVQELNELNPGAAAETSVQLVDPALTPTEPESPQPAIMLALGLFAGLGAGMTLVLALARRDDSPRTEAAVEQLTGHPSIGSVPFVRGRRVVPLEVATHRATAQSFSRIRNNLLQRLPTSRPVLAVVGLEAGDGKTSVSAGLARALAQHGYHVLLVDADPRDHHLTSGLALEDQLGWLNWPEDVSSVSDLVVKGVSDGLDVVPVGVPEPRSRYEDDHLARANTALRPVLEKLSPDYDVVIVDTADLRTHADSALIARYADGTVLVVPAGQLRQHQVALALDTVSKAGGVLLGSVLNFSSGPLR